MENSTPALQRRLGLPLLVLYGLGVTVGAGIYVLVGLTAAQAGYFAPMSFLLAAIIVAFTGFTYAELTARFPVSAGEAEYVANGLRSKFLSLSVGLLVATSGVVSAAVVSLGASAYLGQFIPLAPPVLTIAIVLTLGLIAAKGILESVSLAAFLTIIELLGLGFVVYYGVSRNPELFAGARQLIPPFEAGAWSGIVSGGLLAFFAFIGFEDLANVAEEAKRPKRTMPKAILITLITSTVIYLIVVSVVVLAVPMEELTASASPLALVFKTASPATLGTFNVVAALATLNGVLIQMIMSSRVLYGLADQGRLPKSLAYIHPKTHTPFVATALVVSLILGLALFFPIGRLAQTTSQIALVIFSCVNLSLVVMKISGKAVMKDHFQVPIWVPILGFLSCLLLLFSSLI